MRPFIIVTVKDKDEKWNYDMELPTDIPTEQLVRDVAEALNIYNRELLLPPGKHCLYCLRKKKALPEGKTLAELGIWTGDILILQ